MADTACKPCGTLIGAPLSPAEAYLRAGVCLAELRHGDLPHVDVDGVSGPDIGLAISAVISHGNCLQLQTTHRLLISTAQGNVWAKFVLQIKHVIGCFHTEVQNW